MTDEGKEPMDEVIETLAEEEEKEEPEVTQE